jgi:molecular chaperone DnaK (HSP70)
MHLGVDFGTTRIVVAAVDRGNYPVLTFDSPGGEASEWYPALVAVREGELLYGWNAWMAQEDAAATIVRSIKRYLSEAGPQSRVEIAGRSYPILDLLRGMCADLKASLPPADKYEILLGVPANANGNQRFLTAEAFREAGFDVLGLLNEPSAASIEFGHANRSAKRDRILVYDLGGGTFDASLVEMDELRHEVIASEGIPSLGGDDFDDLLADLALEQAGITATLAQPEMFRLHEECRRQKEALHPNTRRITIDLELAREGWPSVAIPVSEFYARCEPLIAETMHAVRELLQGRDDEIEALYVIGGASELPLVSRALKAEFGRRVRRSAYTRSATAIGLAIQSDSSAGYRLREKFTRNFGVWREADAGRVIVFDPLFCKGVPLPAVGAPPLEVRRQYRPAHNIGHFRYLECSHTSEDGRPSGEVTIWDDIQFPFDPRLRDHPALNQVPIQRQDWAPHGEVEELYQCDSSGSVAVTISNRTAGYQRTYRLGRWSAPALALVPAKKRAGRAKKA